MNHTRTVVVLAAAGLLLTACSSSPPTADGRPATRAAIPGPGTATITASTDATGAFKTITAKIPTAKLGGTVTAESDPNHLLGRPGQYTSKVTFTDSRITTADTQGLKPGDVQLGGAVETFSSAGDAATRAKYIQTVTKSIPALAEYDYVHGTNVIRVSHYLTPDQAGEYKAAAGKLP